MGFRIENWNVKLAISLVVILGIVSLVRAEGEGEKIYMAKCAACHGVDGSAQTKAGQNLHAPDFHSPALAQATDADLAGVVAQGRNKMPKFGERLTGKEINSVVAYVRTLAKAH